MQRSYSRMAVLLHSLCYILLCISIVSAKRQWPDRLGFAYPNGRPVPSNPGSQSNNDCREGSRTLETHNRKRGSLRHRRDCVVMMMMSTPMTMRPKPTVPIPQPLPPMPSSPPVASTESPSSELPPEKDIDIPIPDEPTLSPSSFNDDEETDHPTAIGSNTNVPSYDRKDSLTEAPTSFTDEETESPSNDEGKDDDEPTVMPSFVDSESPEGTDDPATLEPTTDGSDDNEQSEEDTESPSFASSKTDTPEESDESDTLDPTAEGSDGDETTEPTLSPDSSETLEPSSAPPI